MLHLSSKYDDSLNHFHCRYDIMAPPVVATLLATVPVLASVWLLPGSVGSVRNTVRTIQSKYKVYGYSVGYFTSTGKCAATPRESR